MLPALIVGALTAWFLGLKLGLIVAGVTFVAVVVASLIPGATLTVYALVLAWCALLYFFGAKFRKPSAASAIAGGTLGTLGKWVGKARRMFEGDTNRRGSGRG